MECAGMAVAPRVSCCRRIDDATLAEGLACRLADLAHYRDLVGQYLHLKELWTEITSMNCL